MVAATVVLVTGVPAAGKSTVAAILAAELPADLISLDVIKERRYASDPAIGNTVELRLAAEAELWSEIATAHGPVVVDLWVSPGRDDRRVAAALAEYRVIEVLCRVPAEVAVARYLERDRSGPHQPADEPTLDRIRTAAAAIGPLGVGPCLELDTDQPLDPATVVVAVRALTEAAGC